MRVIDTLAILTQLTLPLAALSAQAATKLTQQVRNQYVSVTEPVVALTNVTIIDGTGTAPKPNQTIVIQNGRIASGLPSPATITLLRGTDASHASRSGTCGRSRA